MMAHDGDLGELYRLAKKVLGYKVVMNAVRLAGCSVPVSERDANVTMHPAFEAALRAELQRLLTPH